MKKIMLFILVIGVKVGLSQNNTWNGATDNDWHKACNWSAGTIPSASDNVYIPTASPYPVISGNAHCKTLNITSTAASALTIQSSASGNLCISSINTGPCVTVILDNGGCVTTATCGAMIFMTTNINVGTKINGAPGGQNMSAPGGNEKYCYNDVEANCTTYGGLYEWGEAMNYVASSSADPSGVQGICPAGYHIPSDNEWSDWECCLESMADGCATFDGTTGFRGTDVGDRMKDDVGWNGTNSSNFSALPAGYRDYVAGVFSFLGTTIHYRTATESNATSSWGRTLGSAQSRVARTTASGSKNHGESVRCMKN